MMVWSADAQCLVHMNEYDYSVNWDSGDSMNSRLLVSCQLIGDCLGFWNLLIYLLYYAEACDEFTEPIFASLHLDNTTPFKEMSQWWRVIDN